MSRYAGWLAALALATMSLAAGCADVNTPTNDTGTISSELVLQLCGGPKDLQCAKGQYCKHRPGTCDDASAYGTCQPTPQLCPLYLKPVCGCDGETYGNECEMAAAGVSLDHDGPCTVPCIIGGDPCPDGMACDPLPGCLKSLAGECKAMPKTCPRLWAPVCGCDGKTYANDCKRQQAGVSAAYDGVCPQKCGGFLGKACPKGEFCLFPPDTCNWADQEGTCTKPPHVCPLFYKPVCACNGKTYGNECEMLAAGQSKDHDGKCCNFDILCKDGTAPVDTDGDGCADTCKTKCTSTCDCYDAKLEFSAPCNKECATCDNFWTCSEAGFCEEQCGPVPPETQLCTSNCLSDADCGKGEYCSLTEYCPCPLGTDPACLAPCYLIGECRNICEILDQIPNEVCNDDIDNDCDGLIDEDCGCTSDADCKPGTYCQVDFGCDPTNGFGCGGACVAIPDGACNSDADCGDGQYCEPPTICPLCLGCPCFGQCKDKLPPEPCCKSDAECGKGTCVNNVCKDPLPMGQCWQDSDCSPNSTCQGEIVCPCGALCILADSPGKCVSVFEPCSETGGCPKGSSCQCETDPQCPDCDGCYFACVPDKVGCYGDQDCPDGLKCNAADLCLPPPGCLPGMACPTVCYGYCVQ